MKKAFLCSLLSLPLCCFFLASFLKSQEPTWEDLKKAADEAGQKGEYAKENHLLKAALEQAEKSFEPFDPRLAEALKQLAGASAIGLSSDEILKHIERTYQRIVRIDEHNLGSDDPEVAADLVTWASHYPYWEDDKAPPLYEKALNIYEQAGISEGSGLLNFYFNLAGRSLLRKEYSTAESYYRHALVIEMKGPHGCESSALTGLASTLIAEGKHREAEQLHVDALAETERKSAYDHCVQMKLGTLAKFYAEHGQPDRAETTLIRGVALAQRTHGAKELYVVVALDALADFYKQRKSPDAALRAYQQGLAIIEQHQDSGDESDAQFLAGHLCTIARFLQELKMYSEAESYYKWAIACYERLDVRNSRFYIASVWREVAGLYVQQGRSDEAEKLLKDALAWDEGYSPPVSMAVLGDLEMLESKIYIPQARFADAERTIRRQMALRETQYGRDSSPVADLLDRHAVVLEKLNRTDEAQRAKAEAKAIRQSLGQNIGDW